MCVHKIAIGDKVGILVSGSASVAIFGGSLPIVLVTRYVRRVSLSGLSFPPADKFPQSDRHGQAVETSVSLRLVDHGLQGFAMTDRIVRDQHTAGDQFVPDNIKTLLIEVLLAVKEAERDVVWIIIAGQKITVNQLCVVGQCRDCRIPSRPHLPGRPGK